MQQMMKSVTDQDSAQAMQRVRVGMTGLAMVLVMIGLASVIFTSASRDEPVSAIGASNAGVVANLTEGNTTQFAKEREEPLATVGAAPSTTSTETVNAAEINRREARRQGQQ